MSFHSVVRRGGGFTAVEAVVLVVIVVVLSAIVLAALSSQPGRGGSRGQMPNASQLRGLHQALVVYAQGNKSGGADGWFPGLNNRGELLGELPQGLEPGVQVGDPAVFMKLLLDGDFFTPEYAINPADDTRVPWETTLPFGPRFFSYAALSLTGPDGESAEWRETLNTSAIVLADRAIGTGPDDITSVWSDEPGSYRGTMTRNDGSTALETTPLQEDTKYGDADAINASDDVFADEPGALDAFLIHPDGRTAYSAD